MTGLSVDAAVWYGDRLGVYSGTRFGFELDLRAPRRTRLGRGGAALPKPS